MKTCFSHITLDGGFGTISGMVKDAIAIAKTTGCKVSFRFNGVMVNVTDRSQVDDVSQKALNAVRVKTVSVYGEGW